MNDADIYITIKKCNNKYGQWGGYLRPDEIIGLVRRKFLEYHRGMKRKNTKGE